MESDILKTIIGAIGGLIVGIFAAGISLIVERRKYKIELAKLMSSLNSVSEVEKARIEAYRILWGHLEGISTWRPQDIIGNLPKAQDRLQDWYYRQGGGLIIGAPLKRRILQRPLSSPHAILLAPIQSRHGRYSTIWAAASEEI
jgi:hypothetical protein